jgi:precorrin-4/cobalt-precorrin-4 C11-methyltransferase
MRTGRVTFIAVTPSYSDSLSWRARQIIGEADIVIWTGDEVCRPALHVAPAHADVFLAEEWSIHPLLPFYDLASRDGFRVAHIRSDTPIQWEQVGEHIDRCSELGLTTELVRA